MIGLEPLRAAVITHFGRPDQAGVGPARMLDSDGVRHRLAKFADVINVYLDSGFAVTSQAAAETAKNEPLASNQRGHHQHRLHRRLRGPTWGSSC